MAEKALPEPKTCNHCCYFQEYTEGGGECRRLPPTRASHIDGGRFPNVSSDSWCGEFGSRQGPKAPAIDQKAISEVQ